MGYEQNVYANVYYGKYYLLGASIEEKWTISKLSNSICGDLVISFRIQFISIMDWIGTQSTNK